MWASSARKNILASLSWDTNPEEDMASGKACANSCIVKPYDYNAASLLNCSSNIIPPYQAGNACMWASSARKNILANLSWDTNPEEDMASGKACANSCIVKPYDYNAASLLNCSSNIIPPYQAGNACMWASSARKNILASLIQKRTWPQAKLAQTPALRSPMITMQLVFWIVPQTLYPHTRQAMHVCEHLQLGKIFWQT